MLIKLTLLFLVSGLVFEYKSGKNILFQLGDARCTIHIIEKKKPIANLIVLHGNETTCIKSFLALPDSCAFELFEIKQEGNRLLKYDYNNGSYYFDPNRMFSKKGIINTLRKNNKSYVADIVIKIKYFADSLLHILTPRNSSEYIIAMHNNTNGNFSVKSYSKSSDAAQVYICKSEDPDDFFIVTKIADFSFFKSQFQNVVLQSKVAKDDGSLSIYCEGKNIPYINIEAEDGHLKKQTEMLLLCQKHLTK